MHAADRAASWRLDVKGADVRARLAESGIPCLLLKGRAFAELFYADGSPRPYVDCDLLVPAALRDRARTVLTDLGFAAGDGAVHSQAWHREADRVWVDLHHTLPQLDVDPERVWAILWPRAVSSTIGGAPTRVLDPAAAALLTALHLVHHGPRSAAPRQDLERAIDQLGEDCWGGAAELARELEAEAALGTGLRLVPAGVAVAERLGLDWAPSTRVLLEWDKAPWGTTVWDALASAPDARAFASLVVRFLAPTPDFLRARSALARSSRVGLVLAYLVRPVQLAIKAAMSYAPWLRARREAAEQRRR
jgi:hypothetical protein